MIRLDTNIFIDLLNGCKQAGIELRSCPEPAIRVITRNPKDFHKLTVPVHVPYDWNSQTGTVSNIRPPLGSPLSATKARGILRIK